jgi:hypothetical protein
MSKKKKKQEPPRAPTRTKAATGQGPKKQPAKGRRFTLAQRVHALTLLLGTRERQSPCGSRSLTRTYISRSSTCPRLITARRWRDSSV